MATGSKLVIVESPTKAKKIGGYLGSGYTVMASVGHIRDLAQPSQVPAAEKAKYGKFGVDIEDGFKPYYIVDGNKKKTVADLKSALKKADTLYLATDEDREGEAIAWHLVQTLKPKVPVKRMVFHEITPEAIKASLNNTRDVDAAMVDAQETRRILDLFRCCNIHNNTALEHLRKPFVEFVLSILIVFHLLNLLLFFILLLCQFI